MATNGTRGFLDLDVYKECRKFRRMIAALAKTLPKQEEYELRKQIVASSRSVTANIAEGHGRFHYLDNTKFLYNSRGSLEETKEHLITAFDEAYITAEQLKVHVEQHGACIRLLNGYIAYLKEQKRDRD